MSSFDIASLRQKLNELKGKGNQNNDYLKNFYNPPEFDSSLPKRSTIRVLPGGSDPDTGEMRPWFAETVLHKINGKNLHSPKIIGKPCPITEYIRALWSTGDPEKIELAREIKGRKRFYMNVIVRERLVTDAQGRQQVIENDGPLIYSCGVKVFEKILKHMVDEEEYGDITDLENGFDFRIEKEMQSSGYPGYDDSKCVRDSSRAGSAEEIERWMSNLHNLPGLIKYLSYEELAHELELFKSTRFGETNNTDNSLNITSSAVQHASSSPVGETESSSNFSPPSNTEESSEEDFLEALKKIQNRG